MPHAADHLTRPPMPDGTVAHPSACRSVEVFVTDYARAGRSLKDTQNWPHAYLR